MKITIAPDTLREVADACEKYRCAVAAVDTSASGMTVFVIETKIGVVDLGFEPGEPPPWYAGWTGASSDIIAESHAESAEGALCDLFKRVADLVKAHKPEMPF